MPPNLSRGQRDAKDIIEAAIQQGWTKRDATRNNSHVYLVPPSGGVPVGVSSSPSDRNFRHSIVRQLRKSGFVWPPPDVFKSAKIEEEAVLSQVIAAAEDQGWQVAHEERAIVFCPPDTRKPQLRVDTKKQGINLFELRNLKNSGLVWPWTPREHVEPEEDVTQELVQEFWKQMDWNEEYELSNAGRCRKIDSGKMIYPDGAGMISLTHRGRRQQKNLRGLVINHFGHPPLKNVAMTDEAMGHRTTEVMAVMTQEPEPIDVLAKQEPDLIPEVVEDNQEKTEVTASVAEVLERPYEIEDGWAWVDHVPEAVPGYSVSILGDARGPGGEPKSLNNINGQLWLYMRRPKTPGDSRTVRAIRMDSVVLTVFGQPKPDSSSRARHHNGDNLDCSLDNLKWVSKKEFEALPEKKTSKPVVAESIETKVDEVVDALVAKFNEEPETVEVKTEDPIEEFLAIDAQEANAKVEAYQEFKKQETTVVAEEEEAVDVPVEAKGIEQLVAEGIDDYTADVDGPFKPEPKPRRTYKRKSRAKAKVASRPAPAPKQAAPSTEIRSGKFWEHVGTGQIMYVYDDGVPEFPQATTPEEGKVLLKLAALAQEWVSLILR